MVKLVCKISAIITTWLLSAYSLTDLHLIFSQRACLSRQTAVELLHLCSKNLQKLKHMLMLVHVNPCVLSFTLSRRAALSTRLPDWVTRDAQVKLRGQLCVCAAGPGCSNTAVPLTYVYTAHHGTQRCAFSLSSCTNTHTLQDASAAVAFNSPLLERAVVRNQTF